MRYCSNNDYSEFLGPKIYKTQHIPKHICVLPKYICVLDVFSICWAYSSVLERNNQGCIQKSFLVISNYKKIWNRAKTIFLVHVPPLFPPIQCLPGLISGFSGRNKTSIFPPQQRNKTSHMVLVGTKNSRLDSFSLPYSPGHKHHRGISNIR